jgi:hypothetical protein
LTRRLTRRAVLPQQTKLTRPPPGARPERIISYAIVNIVRQSVQWVC